MPNGGPPMRTESVTVLGLGKEGREMLAPIARHLERVGVYFPQPDADDPSASAESSIFGRLVAMDRQNQFEDPDQTPSHTIEFALRNRQNKNPDEMDIDYLHPDATVGTQQDAKQHRGIGRYLLEVNYEHIRERLQAEVEALAPDESGLRTIHQVWIVHSMGNGFASGAMPLLASLIRELEVEIATETGSKILIGGIGILPSLPESSAGPDPPASRFVNTYTTLRELEYLQKSSDSDTDRYPLELSLPAADSRDRIELEIPPFHLYGFAKQTFANQNATAQPQSVTNTISAALGAFTATRSQPYYGGAPDPRGIGRPPRYGASIFVGRGPPPNRSESFEWFWVSGQTVRVQTQQIQEYQAKTAERKSIERELSTITSELHSLSEEKEYLSNILSNDGYSELLSETSEEIIETTLSGLPETDAKKWIQDQEQKLSDNIDEDITEAAAKYVFYRRLGHSYSKQARDVHFAQEVEETADQLGRSVDETLSESPLDWWQDDIKPALEEDLAHYEDLRDSTLPIRIFRLRELEDRIDWYTERKEFVNKVASEFERLQTLGDWCRKHSEQYRAQLTESLAEYDSTIDELVQDRDQYETQKEELISEMELLETELQNKDRDQDGVSLPVQVEEIKDSKGINTLSEMYKNDIINPDSVIEVIQTTVNELVDWGTFRVFGLMEETNRSVLIGSDISLNTNPYSDVTVQWVDADFPSSILFVCVKEPYEMNQINEYSRLHECFVDPPRNIAELFETDSLSDEEVRRRFAYPEFIASSDDQI